MAARLQGGKGSVPRPDDSTSEDPNISGRNDETPNATSRFQQLAQQSMCPEQFNKLLQFQVKSGQGAEDANLNEAGKVRPRRAENMPHASRPNKCRGPPRRNSPCKNPTLGGKADNDRTTAQRTTSAKEQPSSTLNFWPNATTPGVDAAEKLPRGAPDGEEHAPVTVGTVKVVGEGDELIVFLRGEGGRVCALQLAVFLMPLGESLSVAKLVKHGTAYLFLHDEDGFIGSGHFTGVSHLDVSEDLDFTRAKHAVLKGFQIQKILEDRLRVLRDEALGRWRSELDHMVAQGDIKHTTEMIQIQRKFEKSCDASMDILEHVRRALSLPVELKEASSHLFVKESKVQERTAKFGCFSQSLVGDLHLCAVSDVFNAACSLALENYHQSLEQLIKDTGSLGDKMVTSLARLRTSPMLLCVRYSDIEYFKSLEAITKKFGVSNQLAGIFTSMWDTFLQNATKMRQTKTLMTPIYLYLLTSFMETITELSARTKRKVYDDENTRWADHDGLLKISADSWDLNSIRWKTGSNIQDRALERESRFLVHIMDHAKPGVFLSVGNINKCRTCKPSSESFWQRPFKALMRLNVNTTTNNEPVESLVWTTVLRNGMHYLLTESQRKEDEFFHMEYEELLKSLEDAYATFVSTCFSSESCRVVGREIARFAAQMFEQMASVTRPCDAELLRSQTDFVRSMMDSKKHGVQRYGKYLPPLIAEFVGYWENRKDFDLAVVSSLTCDAFSREIRDTCDDLHATLNAVLVKTELAPDLILDYLRLFNEFLTTFQQISFVWLVEIDPTWGPDLAGQFRRTVTGKNTRHYEVTNQKAFVETLTAANIDVPKHYVLSIARRLTALIFTSLVHEASDEQTRVQGTGNLLEAVRKAFIHLDDQINYHSFEQFENDLCQPFESVASKMNHYADFKRHLDNLENFFVYTRRQNEIDIDKALDIFERIMDIDDDGMESTVFDADVLRESFSLYDKAFKDIISQHYNGGMDVVNTLKSTFFVQEHSKWDATFRRQRIPVLLAAVSAFWSIRESVHVIKTGNSIKPHCIQTLCVLRLLNVDQDGRGLRKHLAEVLTGQGKSLVLALLASVLALTGHFVQIVCYSKYLAERDQLAFEEFFVALGILDKVKYGTFDDLANEVLRIEMNGTVRYARDLFRDMILDSLPAATKNWRASNSSKSSSVLLIDEVDVFFTKEFYGNLYRLGVRPGISALVLIQEEIWEKVTTQSTWLNNVANITAHVQRFVTEIVRKDSDRVFTHFYTTSANLFQTHLNRMISDAMQVNSGAESNDRFKINEDGFLLFREADGLYNTRTSFGYQNAFNYLRLKQNNFNHMAYRNYGYLSIVCGEVSYAELPNEYSVILGVSGTISTLSREENAVVRDSYGIKDVSCMPTFFGKVNLEFDPANDFQIVDGKAQWQETILKSVSQKQQQKRAVIVFFDAELDMDQFVERFKNDLTGVNKLTGNEGAAELDRLIRDAGVAGSLTLAIRAMGRGVDYRTSLTVEQHGGVHVVQTFLSLDVKEETQIKGRTARKDNKGSYELILCKQRLANEVTLGFRDGNIGYAALHAKRINQAAEEYKKNAQRVRESLDKHQLSLKVIKSFARYDPKKRSSYFSKYPFA